MRPRNSAAALTAGDVVEVRVEGAVAAEFGLQAVQLPVPSVHGIGAMLRLDAPGIIGQALAFEHNFQPGKEGDAGIIRGNMSGMPTLDCGRLRRQANDAIFPA